MCRNHWFLLCFIDIPDFLLEAIWIRVGLHFRTSFVSPRHPPPGQPAAQGIPKVSVLCGRVDQECKKVPFRADETSAEDSRPRLKFAGPQKNGVSRRRDAIFSRLDDSIQTPKGSQTSPPQAQGVIFLGFLRVSCHRGVQDVPKPSVFTAFYSDPEFPAKFNFETFGGSILVPFFFASLPAACPPG